MRATNEGPIRQALKLSALNQQSLPEDTIIPGTEEHQEHQLKTPSSTVNDPQTTKGAWREMGQSQVGGDSLQDPSQSGQIYISKFQNLKQHWVSIHTNKSESQPEKMKHEKKSSLE